MLSGIDTLVFDIQDVGVRYYTYLTTLVYVLEEGGAARDPGRGARPAEPHHGRVVEGPLMDPDLRSFTAPHTIPVRTGMTIGEFAQMVVAERKLPVRSPWSRSRAGSASAGSTRPALPVGEPVAQYPARRPRRCSTRASGLLEATNLSVGRGTEMPFEVIGAPWIDDPQGLADALNARGLPGVQFEPVFFTPTSSVYAGRPVRRRAARGDRPRGDPAGDGGARAGPRADASATRRASGRRPSRTCW